MTEKTADSASQQGAASNGSVTSSDASGGSRRFSSYLQSVAQISGIVTIVAATVYALGVFTLVLPIKTTYDSTFPAAWYAVSVVPKTVVVGHGIKSLTWPSLILTLATTFFVMTIMWAWNVLLVGGRHVRLTASKPTLNLNAMAFIYAICGTFVLLVLYYLYTLGPSGGASGERRWLSHTILGNIVDNVLGVGQYLSFGLIVPTCALAAVFLIIRTLRFTRQLIRTRTLPRMPLSDLGWGLVSQGAIFVGLLSGLLLSVDLFYFVFIDGDTPTEIISTNFFLLFLFLCLVITIRFFLRWARYLTRSITSAIKTKDWPSPTSTSFRSLPGRVTQRIHPYSMTLLYSGILFSALWLVISVAMINLELIVLRLVDDIASHQKEASPLDEWLVPLLIFGACVSASVMYWKDWKGFHHSDQYFLSHTEWKLSLKTLIKSLSSRSLGRGFFLSLGVAYLVALVSAFFLAVLNPPPLPKVQVNELAPLESSKLGQVPAFQEHTLKLLTHTEGYWYLVDQEAGDILVIPDQDDKLIRLRLDEQSTPEKATSLNRWDLLE